MPDTLNIQASSEMTDDMTTLQLARPLVVLDLETTGVDVEKDRIVEICMHRIGGGAATVTMLLNPGRPIPTEATAVHGITDADVANKPSFNDVHHELLAFLSGADVAGFNVRSFDVPMLSAEFKRCGITWPGQDVSIVDAFRIYNRMEPRTLGAAVRHYLGREHDGAHGAEADVRATAEVIEEQARRYGVTTLAELELLERDPDWLDADGKIRWQGDVAVIGFGKWAGKPLAQVDPGYLRWMLDQKFASDVVKVITAALRGEYPTRNAK
jgi:DNA polymerase-3 subunit epsilon